MSVSSQRGERRADQVEVDRRTALAQGCQSLSCACCQFTQTTQYTIPQASVRRGVQLFPTATAPEIPPCTSSLELASTAGFVRSLLLLVHALSPLVPSRKYRPLFTAAARSAQGELGCLSSRDARAGPIEALAEISHFVAAANAVLAQRARLLWFIHYI